MRIELDGNEILLRAPTNAAIIVRQIPGARHDKARTDLKSSAWILPLSWATCVTARGVIGPTLEVGPKLAEWAQREKAERIDPALALRDAKELPAGWDDLFNAIEGAA